jgi:NhaP-type Na+/H+ or K+/H+ antiporter
MMNLNHTWLAIVLMVLGLSAAVAGSFKYSSRPCLLVFSLLFGLALGVALGHCWLATD